MNKIVKQLIIIMVILIGMAMLMLPNIANAVEISSSTNIER